MKFSATTPLRPPSLALPLQHTPTAGRGISQSESAVCIIFADSDSDSVDAMLRIRCVTSSVTCPGQCCCCALAVSLSPSQYLSLSLSQYLSLYFSCILSLSLRELLDKTLLEAAKLLSPHDLSMLFSLLLSMLLLLMLLLLDLWLFLFVMRQQSRMHRDNDVAQMLIMMFVVDHTHHCVCPTVALISMYTQAHALYARTRVARAVPPRKHASLASTAAAALAVGADPQSPAQSFFLFYARSGAGVVKKMTTPRPLRTLLLHACVAVVISVVVRAGRHYISLQRSA